MTDGTQSVLDQMVSGIMTRKAALTPVGLEKGMTANTAPLAGTRNLPFPSDKADVSQEALRKAHNAVRQAQEQLSIVAEDIAALSVLYGADLTHVAVVPPPTDLPAAIAAGTEEFRERFARQQAAAQAATWVAIDAAVSPPDLLAEAAYAVGRLWVCPTHGDANITQETSRKGRKYRACSACMQFEK